MGRKFQPAARSLSWRVPIMETETTAGIDHPPVGADGGVKSRVRAADRPRRSREAGQSELSPRGARSGWEASRFSSSPVYSVGFEAEDLKGAALDLGWRG
jgi:hypothetical protein